MFTDQINGYLRTLNTSSTQSAYALSLHQFHEWYLSSYGEEPDASLLTAEEAREWRSYLTNIKRFSAATVNQRLAALRGVVRHYGRSLPIKGMKKVDAPIEPLNGRQIGRLLAVLEGPRWLDKRNVAIVSLMVRTGLRVSEVVSLYSEDLTISERKGQIVIRQGKGLKERTVPLSRLARAALEEYLEVRPSFANHILFVSHSGSPMASRDVQRLVGNASNKAGISGSVTPHILRHTFATRALRQAKMDLATLSRILGHENLTTTARYLHPDQNMMSEMIEDL
ncbi:MAG: tyrosine-type recombinase/integrase [Anaerolineales bacterium]|nr:tyrosine-type recombinase/integrase [Anaerolineales bacterium]